MKRLLNRITGASLTEFGILAGLVSVVAIGAVGKLGQETGSIFCTASNALPFAEGTDCSAYGATDVAGSETGGAAEEDPFDQPTDTLDLVYDLSSGAGSVGVWLVGTSFDIDWGDGTVETFSVNGPRYHSYASAGIYPVSISGTVTQFTNYDPYDKLTEVTSWGDVGLQRFNMQNADSLSSIAHIPASITSLSSAFYRVDDVPDEVGSWDVSSVDDMSHMFLEAGGIPDLSGWDTSNVEDTQRMFFRAPGFNQDLSGWDVGKVENMADMFYGVSAMGDITGWDTSSVTNMWRVFRDSTAFDQDISGWDVDQVTNCAYFDTNSGLALAHRPNFTSCTP